MLGLHTKVDKSDKMLYVIGEMGRDNLMNGRKKLMKIMFFLEHFSLEKDKLVEQKLFSKNEFIIYKFGPFSFEVMDTLDKLKKENLVVEEETNMHIVAKLTSLGEERKKELEEDMEENEKKRIKGIIKKFGKKSSQELEDLSLKYMNITKEEKTSYMGNPVTVIIAENETN